MKSINGQLFTNNLPPAKSKNPIDKDAAEAIGALREFLELETHSAGRLWFPQRHG